MSEEEEVRKIVEDYITKNLKVKLVKDNGLAVVVKLRDKEIQRTKVSYTDLGWSLLSFFNAHFKSS